MPLQLAHSPDPDDAFMFYALAEKKIPTGGLEFLHTFADIETLNRAAFEGKFEITALSLHAFAYVADRYWLLPSGASIGKGYGPVVVAKELFPWPKLSTMTIAVPGVYTTAALLLGLAVGSTLNFKVLPFSEILLAVQKGEADAGIVIHEGQLTYPEFKLCKILDLGSWWEEKTSLPLPLGVDAVRKDLGIETARKVSKLLEESIVYALTHQDEALEYALKFGRGISRKKARKFVGMYVNERTLCYSEEDKRAVWALLCQGHEAGLLPVQPDISFVPAN